MKRNVNRKSQDSVNTGEQFKNVNFSFETVSKRSMQFNSLGGDCIQTSDLSDLLTDNAAVHNTHSKELILSMAVAALSR